VQALNLLTRNMSDFDRESWDINEKRHDLTHAEASVLARCLSGKLVGFALFRFVQEETVPVVYLYEIQLDEEVRGQGLGGHLMRAVQRVGRESGQHGLMLTVHLRNKGAVRFYENLSGFEVSPTSPSQCAPPHIAADCGYEVYQCLWEESARQVMASRAAAAKRALHVEALDEGALRVKLVQRTPGGTRRSPGGSKCPKSSPSSSTGSRDSGDSV
jgi:GNAT superfamily N-acetyltransferase